MLDAQVGDGHGQSRWGVCVRGSVVQVLAWVRMTLTVTRWVLLVLDELGGHIGVFVIWERHTRTQSDLWSVVTHWCVCVCVYVCVCVCLCVYAGVYE